MLSLPARPPSSRGVAMPGAGGRRQKEQREKGGARAPAPRPALPGESSGTVSGPVFRQLAHLLSRVFTAV